MFTANKYKNTVVWTVVTWVRWNYFPEFPSISGSRSELAKRGIYLRPERRNHSSSCCPLKSLLASRLDVVTVTESAGFQLILTPLWSVFSSFPQILDLLAHKDPRPITRHLAFKKYLMTDQCKLSYNNTVNDLSSLSHSTFNVLIMYY